MTLKKQSPLVFKDYRMPSEFFLLRSLSHLTLTKGLFRAHISFLKNMAILGLSPQTLPASTEPFKFIQKEKISDVYWRRLLENEFIY